jgi:hypothetical protein
MSDATGEDVPAGLRRARTLAYLMDTSVGIPFTRARFGLDALLGLVPVLGDAVGAALSTYIVAVGVRARVPGATLLEMLWNIAVEALGGSVPLVGDVFDAVWKANVRNVRLLERDLDLPAGDGGAAKATIVAVGVGLLLLLVLSTWVSLKVALWILGLVSVALAGSVG